MVAVDFSIFSANSSYGYASGRIEVAAKLRPGVSIDLSGLAPLPPPAFFSGQIYVEAVVSRLHPEEHAARVDVELGVVLVGRHARRMRDRDDAGVRHVNIQRAEVLAHRLCCEGMMLDVGHIALDAQSAVADLAHGVVQDTLTPTGYDHPGAFHRE